MANSHQLIAVYTGGHRPRFLRQSLDRSSAAVATSLDIYFFNLWVYIYFLSYKILNID